MGFTVGAGGSGIIAEGAVTADKIADGAVSPEKLDGTGTPGATNYYRGDGAWATPAGDSSVLGETTLGSDGTTISVTLSEAIGDDEYITLAYNFVCTAVNQDIKLFLNGETSETGYTVNGTPNTAKLYTSANDSVRYGSLNVVPIPYAGNLFVEATGVIWDSGATRYSRQLTGLGGITSIQLVTTGQFKAGSNLKVMRLSGAGVQGATGPTGPAATDWQTATQASNGNTLTLTLADGGGALYELDILVLSQTAGSLIELELNQSAGSYSYYQQYNGVPDAGAGSYVLAGTAAVGSKAVVSGRAFTNGTIAGASTSGGLTGVGVSQAFVYKTLGAPANLTHITVKSSGANGIGAGSFVKARKIS